jgi:sulfonate transport system substrate-binding protein
VALSRRSLASVLGMSALALVASCGGRADGAASATTPPVVIRIGDQSQSIETPLRASGLLDGLPYRVEFKAFASGPLVSQAFNAKEIDVGLLGDTPASGTVAAKLDLRAVAVLHSDGPSISLLARPGIASVADLRGKRVAYTTGTAQQAFALRALNQAGLNQGDITQVDVTLQQLGTVLEAGAADASVVSTSDRLRYVDAHPGARSLAASNDVQPPVFTYLLSSGAFLQHAAHSAALFDLVGRVIRANAWVKAHPDQWVDAYYVKTLHQDPAFARRVLADSGFPSYVELTPKVQDATQQMVDLLAKARAIPAAFDVAPLFDPAATNRYNTVLKEQTSS